MTQRITRKSVQVAAAGDKQRLTRKSVQVAVAGDKQRLTRYSVMVAVIPAAAEGAGPWNIMPI